MHPMLRSGYLVENFAKVNNVTDLAYLGISIENHLGLCEAKVLSSDFDAMPLPLAFNIPKATQQQPIKRCYLQQ